LVSYHVQDIIRPGRLPLSQIGYGVETFQAGEIDQGVLWLRRWIERSATSGSR
jgi:hypothetical protein